MYPPFFETVVADAGVQGIFGSAPTRVFPIEAPPGVQYPYSVFTTIFGAPENNLGQTPDIDQWVVQVEVYADSIADLRSAGEALRDALEEVAHITTWNGEERDFRTKAFLYSFTVEFWTNREITS